MLATPSKYQAAKALVDSTRPKSLVKSLHPRTSQGGNVKDLFQNGGLRNGKGSTNGNSSKDGPTPLMPRTSNSTVPRITTASFASVCDGSKDSYRDDLYPTIWRGQNASLVNEVIDLDDIEWDSDPLEVEEATPLTSNQTIPPPAAPSLKPVAAIKDSAARAPSSSSETTLIPWSSSPAHHRDQSVLSRTVSVESSNSETSLKRKHVGSSEPQRVASKRSRLPAGFGREENEATTPAPKITERVGYLDATASAIKEQRKQHRILAVGGEKELPNAEKGRTIEPTKPIDPIFLSAEQKHVLELVTRKNQSVFFTGPAGTGKSVLMRSIIGELKKKWASDPERFAVTASTGLAAFHIGGITLHSFAGIGLGKEDVQTLIKKIRRNPKAKNRWLKTKCLIIDEISMVDGDLFDKLCEIARTIRKNPRPWGGIQLVITGDFFQLPPVPDSHGKTARFAFDASTWNTSIDHTIGLNQVFRQKDPVFANMLNEMRLGRISDTTVQTFKSMHRELQDDNGLDTTELFPTRNEVEASNQRKLRNLPGKSYYYQAVDSGDPHTRERLLANMMCPKNLELKVGAQVMLIKNLDDNLVNGSIGRVKRIQTKMEWETGKDIDISSDSEDVGSMVKKRIRGFALDVDKGYASDVYPVVEFRGSNGAFREMQCVPEEWKVELPSGEVQAKREQLPLILAWALSIHKAQGQTLDRVKVDLGRVFEKGQAYVALSRATSQQGLQVLRFEKGKVMAHPKVVQFYNGLYSAEKANAAKNSAMDGLFRTSETSNTRIGLTEDGNLDERWLEDED